MDTRYDGFSSLAAAHGTVAYGSAASVTPTANAANTTTLNSVQDAKIILDKLVDWVKELNGIRADQDMTMEQMQEVFRRAESPEEAGIISKKVADFNDSRDAWLEKDNSVFFEANSVLMKEQARIEKNLEQNPGDSAAIQEAEEYNDLLNGAEDRINAMGLDAGMYIEPYYFVEVSQ